MDLRTIMNSDAAAGASAAPSPSSASLNQPEYPFRDQPAPSSSSSSSYPPGYPPSQPPPLQPPHASPERSSSYGSLQSPYQYQPTPTRSAGAQSQRGPSPPPYGPSSRDSFATPAAFSHPQQQQQQQSSPFAHQPSQPILSVQTPYFPPTYSFHPRESPSAAASLSYPSQHFSPQGSLPGTPRGSVAAPYPRHTPPSARPQSSGHESLSNQASSPWVGQDAHVHMSPTATTRVSHHGSSQQERPPKLYKVSNDRRESDESVSPKTAFPPQSRHDSAASTQPSSVENGAALQDRRSSANSSYVAPSAPPINSSPSARGSVTRETFPTESRTSSSPQAPRVKRRRYNEPPIFARRAVRTKGRCPAIMDQYPAIPKHARNSSQNPWVLRQRSLSMQAPTSVAEPIIKVKAETPPINGPPPPNQQPQQSQPLVQPPAHVQGQSQPPEVPQTGSLGPWEPSITGFIPHEEITKTVCDFLFKHVVLSKDGIAAPAGTSAAGLGAIIEIEAKMGQLIDMERKERLYLPVLTESVIDRDSPRVRTAFESTMTVAQHRAMNNFLNEAVKASMPHSNQGRIPLSYAHKKERDTFYEVPPSELPPLIRHKLNPRHKPKVRVTVDQRTGEVLAKIVKCRVADLDVYSPRTCVDWRVSVNLEMSYDGEVDHLPMVDSSRGGRGDRNKDRMSYRHLAYQVDLTQVAKSEPSMKGEFEHELEVEISAAEIRRQGHLAMAGDPKNQYEELVKGFVDNIRVLARAVPP